MTPLEKIAYYEKGELADYTFDREVEHENGIGRVYQQSAGLSAPRTLVIACTEEDITVE